MIQTTKSLETLSQLRPSNEPPSNGQVVEAKMFVQSADGALYKGKAGGGNQTQVAVVGALGQAGS